MNKFKRHKYHIASSLLLVALIFVAISCNKPSPFPTSPAPAPVLEFGRATISIGSRQLNVQIADTDALRDQGLSGRASLSDSEGMMFVFPRADRYPFWMKNMNFPLDFIWILNGEIVQITQNVQPQPGVAAENLQTLVPDSRVDSVLEVNAGWVEKNNIKVGDTISVIK